MNSLIDAIGQIIFTELGAFLKRKIGKPRSESGDSEFWIGLLVVFLIGAGVLTVILLFLV